MCSRCFASFKWLLAYVSYVSITLTARVVFVVAVSSVPRSARLGIGCWLQTHTSMYALSRLYAMLGKQMLCLRNYLGTSSASSVSAERLLCESMKQLERSTQNMWVPIRGRTQVDLGWTTASNGGICILCPTGAMQSATVGRRYREPWSFFEGCFASKVSFFDNVTDACTHHFWLRSLFLFVEV